MIDLLMIEKALIESVTEESAEVKTFGIRLDKPIRFKPGQFVFLSVLGAGESPFSISSDPADSKLIEVSIQKVGVNTAAIHQLSAGDEIWVRGPYGNPFPIELWKNQKKVIIAGGIGLAPLRSLMYGLLNDSKKKNDIILLYGNRSYEKSIYRKWLSGLKNEIDLRMISEQLEEGGSNRTGLVTELIRELDLDPLNSIAVICGPHKMIEACIKTLEKKGIRQEQIYVSLEMKMKCGIGICGRCNIEHRHICTDGPVFGVNELPELFFG